MSGNVLWKRHAVAQNGVKMQIDINGIQFVAKVEGKDKQKNFFKKLSCYAAFTMVLEHLSEEGGEEASTLAQKLSVRRDELARELGIPRDISPKALWPMANAKILERFGIGASSAPSM